jgi:hypothetical protein
MLEARNMPANKSFRLIKEALDHFGGACMVHSEAIVLGAICAFSSKGISLLNEFHNGSIMCSMSHIRMHLILEHS